MTSIHRIKTGQGGSQIAWWDAEGVYWTKVLQRIDAAKAQFPADVR